MKLWRIPWPWDYHQQGAIIVMASDKNAAIIKAAEFFDKAFPADDRDYGRGAVEPAYVDIIECVDGMTFDGGCDC